MADYSVASMAISTVEMTVGMKVAMKVALMAV